MRIKVETLERRRHDFPPLFQVHAIFNAVEKKITSNDVRRQMCRLCLIFNRLV